MGDCSSCCQVIASFMGIHINMHALASNLDNLRRLHQSEFIQINNTAVICLHLADTFMKKSVRQVWMRRRQEYFNFQKKTGLNTKKAFVSIVVFPTVSITIIQIWQKRSVVLGQNAESGVPLWVISAPERHFHLISCGYIEWRFKQL